MTGSQISVIIFSISLTLFAFFAALLISLALTKKKRHVQRRISAIQPEDKPAVVEVGEQKAKTEGKKKNRQRRATGIRLMDVIQNELMLANVAMKAEEFSVLWLVLTFVPSGLIMLFTFNAIRSIALLAIGGSVPIIILKIKKKKRTTAFEVQLGDALVIMCNCLRSGLSLQQAIETISKEMEAPISVEFARVINEIKYGNNLENALNNLVDRLKSPDLLITVSAINIQRQTGGNLSELLDTISKTIKERIRIKSELRSITAQGRMTGLIIGCLPMMIGAVLMVINPDYMSMFFTETIGKVMVAVAVTMESFGFLIIKKIITVKY